MNRIFSVSAIATGLMLGGCAWNETPRVDQDFGNSVRLMIAEQLYDPEAAREPELAAPDSLDGDAAVSAIKGYGTASSEARVERTRTTGSPIPVVGTISDVEDE